VIEQHKNKIVRARQLGLHFRGVPGPWNAITDISGLEIGHSTLIKGESVRTGVTVILPEGKFLGKVPAGSFVLNGNGECTGLHWVEESGFLEGPIGLTNTCSVGLVRDSLRHWMVQHFSNKDGANALGLLPVVGETWDGWLNDIEGQHIKREHVFEALNNAVSAPVIEGNVGGGTGMVSFGFKAGIGTSSRVISIGATEYCLGVLVQANFGLREDLILTGKSLGLEFRNLMPSFSQKSGLGRASDGSIMAVLATDAPLLPGQLKRLARRMSLGMARTGGIAAHSSGDIFVAFSTACPGYQQGLEMWTSLAADEIDPLLRSAAYATEEAIMNALCAAEDMTGHAGNHVFALPHEIIMNI